MSFQPLEIIATNIQKLSLRVDALEKRPALAPAPTVSTHVPVLATVPAQPINNDVNAIWEAKLAKVITDLHESKRLMETVISMKIESHLTNVFTKKITELKLLMQNELQEAIAATVARLEPMPSMPSMPSMPITQTIQSSQEIEPMPSLPMISMPPMPELLPIPESHLQPIQEVEIELVKRKPLLVAGHRKNKGVGAT